MMGSRSRRVFLCLAASGDPRETAAKKKKEKNWLIFRLKKNYVIFCTTRRSTFFIPLAKSTVATEGAQFLPLYPEGGGEICPVLAPKTSTKSMQRWAHVSSQLTFTTRAVGPYPFFADPDPAVFLNADPDPAT